MSKRAYRATRVNDVNWGQLAQGKDGLDIALGVDVGKYSLWAVCRWADGRFERPWRVQNPGEIPTLLTLLKRVSAGRKLVVAMESSGTYGDALRQALGRQPDRGPAGRWQGGARLCGGLRRGAVATRWQRRSGGGRVGGLGQGHAMGVPASRSLGAGTGVLGGVDGGPPADADDLAGAIGGALGASLAGSDSGAETFLGDVAAGLETNVMGPPRHWLRTGKLPSSWPAGAGRSWRRRRSSNCWPVRVQASGFVLVSGHSVRSRIMPSRPWQHGKKPIERNGGCAAWPRDMRCSKPKGRWWACQRRVSCG